MFKIISYTYFVGKSFSSKGVQIVKALSFFKDFYMEIKKNCNCSKKKNWQWNIDFHEVKNIKNGKINCKKMSKMVKNGQKWEKNVQQW